MKRLWQASAALVLVSGLATVTLAAEAGRTVPLVDHHQHLLSPAMAAHIAPPAGLPDLAPPADLRAVLAAHEAGWNDKAALGKLYADDAVLLDPDTKQWTRGGAKIADYQAERFARPYQLTAVDVRSDGAMAQISGDFSRGEGSARRAFGTFQATLAKTGGGWRITSFMPAFGAPERFDPIDAKALITAMDQAGVQRAVVLSLAYIFGSPRRAAPADELAAVRAENDWTVAQAALYPDRLIPFCSVNPLKDYAIAEIRRCAGINSVRGLKLHVGNSKIEVNDAAQAAKVRAVFAEADRNGLAIVAHLWTTGTYGKEQVEIFLKDILPGAPNVPVQIAHMAGGGPGWTDPALEVLVNAMDAKDPRTRNLYIDVATVADRQTPEQLALMAKRIRQIGTERILYGSDAAFGGNGSVAQEWGTFRGMVPLTDQEFRDIADNVAPYLK